MSALAIASLVQSGFDLRWIAASQATQVGLILLAVPFVVQLIASVFSDLARDAAGMTGLVVVALATYCVLAFELEGQERRPVLPTFRRARGAVALGDGFPE